MEILDRVRRARKELRSAFSELRMAAQRQCRIVHEVVDSRDEARKTGKIPCGIEITGEHLKGA